MSADANTLRMSRIIQITGALMESHVIFTTSYQDPILLGMPCDLKLMRTLASNDQREMMDAFRQMFLGISAITM